MPSSLHKRNDARNKEKSRIGNSIGKILNTLKYNKF